jgi:hypothetical protein
MRRKLKVGFDVAFVNRAIRFPANGVVDNDLIYPMSVFQKSFFISLL